MRAASHVGDGSDGGRAVPLGVALAFPLMLAVLAVAMLLLPSRFLASPATVTVRIWKPLGVVRSSTLTMLPVSLMLLTFLKCLCLLGAFVRFSCRTGFWMRGCASLRAHGLR